MAWSYPFRFCSWLYLHGSFCSVSTKMVWWPWSAGPFPTYSDSTWAISWIFTTTRRVRARAPNKLREGKWSAQGNKAVSHRLNILRVPGSNRGLDEGPGPTTPGHWGRENIDTWGNEHPPARTDLRMCAALLQKVEEPVALGLTQPKCLTHFHHHKTPCPSLYIWDPLLLSLSLSILQKAILKCLSQAFPCLSLFPWIPIVLIVQKTNSGTYHMLLCITIKKTAAILTVEMDLTCPALYTAVALPYLVQWGLNKYVYVEWMNE